MRLSSYSSKKQQHGKKEEKLIYLIEAKYLREIKFCQIYLKISFKCLKGRVNANLFGRRTGNGCSLTSCDQIHPAGWLCSRDEEWFADQTECVLIRQESG